MTAARSNTLLKPGYEGAAPAARLTPREAPVFAEAVEALERRLNDAMMYLTVLEEHDPAGKGSGWPAYVHDWSDLCAQGELHEGKPIRFQPSRETASTFLETMALLDGLRPIYHRVLFLRSLGKFFGGWSFDTIGERYDRSGEWARRAYHAVLVLAARRSGVLPMAHREHAVLVASALHWNTTEHCYLTTAADPRHQLRNIRSLNLTDIRECVVIWTPGQPAAAQLAKAARKNLLRQQKKGSWHLVSIDAMLDLLIEEARALGIEWDLETLPIGVREDEG